MTSTKIVGQNGSGIKENVAVLRILNVLGMGLTISLF